MAEIKERSPSEIRTERRLRNYSLETNQQQPSGSSYLYFRDKVRGLINYHLDKKKPRERLEDPETEFEMPVKTLKKREKRVPPQEELELNEEFEKVKSLISKRAYLIEGAVRQVQSLSKPLATVKVSTNREVIVKQVGDIEDTHLSVIQDMENHLLSVHDSLRVIDKIAQIHAIEQKDVFKKAQFEMTQDFDKERAKSQQKMQALSEHNQQLSQQLKAEQNNREFLDKIRHLESNVSSLTKENQKISEVLNSRQSEISSLQSSNYDKISQIDKLNKEVTDLGRSLNKQQEKYEHEIRNLQAENSASKESYLALDSKDKEIRRLKSEILNLEDELHSTLNKNRKVEEERKIEFSELKEEIQRLQSMNLYASREESHEVQRLRIALEEKDRTMYQEREQFQSEINNIENFKNKQKNEWAEIYTSLKHEIKELKYKIAEMTNENERLLVQVNRNQYDDSYRKEAEVLRQRLKEKDYENLALWEVIVELNNTYHTRGRIDANDLRTLLVVKHLEDKARSKIRM